MTIRRAAATIGLLVACGVALAPSQGEKLDIEGFRRVDRSGSVYPRVLRGSVLKSVFSLASVLRGI
jgi:hypothetical protein